MNFFSVKNLSKFQHYTDRCPPWIKLHRSIFEDYEFACLPDASKLHLIMIWLLASQMDNKVPADTAWLKGKLGIKGAINLKPLVDNGFILLGQDDSSLLQDHAGAGGTEAYKPTEAYKATEDIKNTEEAVQAIEYLNQVCKKKFKPVDANIRPVLARFKEGYGLDDLKLVVDNMSHSWIDDHKMNCYLRPTTLYQGNPKFEGYLNSRPVQKKAKETKLDEQLKMIGEFDSEKLNGRGFQGGDRDPVGVRDEVNGGAAGQLVAPGKRPGLRPLPAVCD